LRKTNKAALAAHFKKMSSPVDHSPNHGRVATVIDGMSLVQKISGNQTTFGEIATSIFNMALKDTTENSRVDLVFDTYQDTSIKGMEWARRAEEEGHQLQSISASHRVHQWRKYLSRVSNKTTLIKFLFEEWQKPEYQKQLNGRILIVTAEEKCFRITSNSCHEEVDLKCTQEEADGRLILHAIHAGNQNYEVVIVSEDTDVLILGLAFADKISTPFYQRFSAKGLATVYEIRKISAALGRSLCAALLGLHAMTGCDSVSAFAGKGKLSALI
jgi:hypothetical protein